MTGVQTVAVDANVLINLALVDRLDILGSLAGFEFVAPAEAVREVVSEVQQQRVASALRAGYLREVRLEDIPGQETFAELRPTMGSGEAACLALAATRGWLVASDEKRLFLREARRRLGPGHVLNTAGLLLLAIRCGRMSVDEADQSKRLLEQHRFRMTFRSFHELL
jgi:predicted nucleic acid-binding protein